jgi:hypothetical protein
MTGMVIGILGQSGANVGPCTKPMGLCDLRALQWCGDRTDRGHGDRGSKVRSLRPGHIRRPGVPENIAEI